MERIRCKYPGCGATLFGKKSFFQHSLEHADYDESVVIGRARSRSVDDLRSLLQDYDRLQEAIDSVPTNKKVRQARPLPTLPNELKEYTFHMYDPNEKPGKKPRPVESPTLTTLKSPRYDATPNLKSPRYDAMPYSRPQGRPTSPFGNAPMRARSRSLPDLQAPITTTLAAATNDINQLLNISDAQSNSALQASPMCVGIDFAAPLPVTRQPMLVQPPSSAALPVGGVLAHPTLTAQVRSELLSQGDTMGMALPMYPIGNGGVNAIWNTRERTQQRKPITNNSPPPMPILLHELPAATMSESKEIDALLTWLTTDDANKPENQQTPLACSKTALPAALCQCEVCGSAIALT